MFSKRVSTLVDTKISNLGIIIEYENLNSCYEENSIRF